MRGGFATGRVVRIAKIARVETSGSYSDATYLQMLGASGGPGLTLFSNTLDVSGYYRYALYRVAYHIETDLRAILFSHLSRLQLAFFDRVQTGQIISRANSDIRAVQMLLPFAPMGLAFDFVKGEGPRVEQPLRSDADIDRLRLFEPRESRRQRHDRPPAFHRYRSAASGSRDAGGRFERRADR